MSTVTIKRRRAYTEGHGPGDEEATSRQVMTGGGPGGQLTYRNSNVRRRGNVDWVGFINEPTKNQYVTFYFGKKTANALASNITDLAFQLKNKNYPSGLSVGTILNPATSAANTREFPLHIYSLCDRIPVGGTPPYDDVVGHFLYMDTNPNINGGGCKFGALTGRDGSNALVNKRSVWSASDISAEGNYKLGDVRRAVLTRVKAEFLLQGSRTNPTTFHIMFIRINNDLLGPLAGSATNTLRDGFFINLVRPMLGSPMIHTPGGNAGVNKDYEVLHSESCTIMPDTSTDLDTSAPKKHLTINFRINQLIDWDYREPVPLADRGLNVNPNYWNTYYRSGTETSSGNGHKDAIPPNMRHRCFMIIRATNPNDGVESGNTIPQYDLDLKMTHTFRSVA